MPDDDELLNTVVEVPHWFEIELRSLVEANHRLTVEGIAKLEDREITETRESLAGEDPELIYSQIRFQEAFYADLRKAAHHLALVGLVTRFQHSLERFVNQLSIRVPKSGNNHRSRLIRLLEALNGSLGEGPVPVLFFGDLVAARDSVIHGDSRAEWQYNNERRTISEQYRNCGELEVTEDQLKNAISKAIQQVKWYDDKLAARRAGVRQSWGYIM